MKVSLQNSKGGIRLLHIRMCSIFSYPDFSERAAGSSLDLVQAPLCFVCTGTSPACPASLSHIFPELLGLSSGVFFNHAWSGAKKMRAEQTLHPTLSNSGGLPGGLWIEQEPGVGNEDPASLCCH